MQGLDTVVITPEFRSCVDALVGRLGLVSTVATSRWAGFADRLGLSTSPKQSTVVVVGAPADVLKHAAGETHEFGFIMPIAQIARPWQRASSWRDDATLDLWSAGWTPVAVDRLRLAKGDVIVEFVIGNARQTPTVLDERPAS